MFLNKNKHMLLRPLELQLQFKMLCKNMHLKIKFLLEAGPSSS